MESRLKTYTILLCLCSAVISIAEILLPESSTRKTVYFILSLIAVSSLISPLSEIKTLPDFNIEIPSIEPNYTDWLDKVTQQEFSKNMTEIITQSLIEKNLTVLDVSVSTNISSDGNVYITMVRVTLDKSNIDRIDETENFICSEFGTVCDITIQ